MGYVTGQRSTWLDLSYMSISTNLIGSISSTVVRATTKTGLDASVVFAMTVRYGNVR